MEVIIQDVQQIWSKESKSIILRSMIIIPQPDYQLSQFILSSFLIFNEAIAAERRIKGWNRSKKEALIKGDFDLLHNLAECKNETSYKNKK